MDSGAVGTWITNNFGLKLWPLIRRLTKEQRENFYREGDNWMPDVATVPLLLLHPGDTLIILPGQDNVHGPITLEDCGMVGGTFWDKRQMRPILKKILNQFEHPNISNEALANQLPAVVACLRDDVRKSTRQCIRTLGKSTVSVPRYWINLSVPVIAYAAKIAVPVVSPVDLAIRTVTPVQLVNAFIPRESSLITRRLWYCIPSSDTWALKGSRVKDLPEMHRILEHGAARPTTGRRCLVVYSHVTGGHTSARKGSQLWRPHMARHR
jgi:hypothetical protein